MKKIAQKTGNSIRKRINRFRHKILTTPITQQAIDFGITLHDPLVSIICINYNGEKHLCALLDSLLTQTYTHYELIIVDNNSPDNSDSTIQSYARKFTAFKYIRSNKNLGFAEGNNLALEQAQGEYIALLNNDTRADKEWLKELVDTLKNNGRCAAATSKTLFWDTFQEVTIQSNRSFTLNTAALKISLEYKKYFIRTGKPKDTLIYSKGNTMTLSLPSTSTAVHLVLTAKDKSNNITIKIGPAPAFSIPCDYTLELSKYAPANAEYIINNAGSLSDQDLLPIDRGFGEYDSGQYDAATELPYFCGCSVLLRRAAMLQRKLFVAELFAYYEDSELSRWLTSAGYTIIYNPKSVVYHKHASTTSEGSALSKLLWRRNNCLFTSGDNLTLLKKMLTEIGTAYHTIHNPPLHDMLIEFDNTLIDRLNTTELLYEQSTAIGIYNSCWSNYGESVRLGLLKVSELQNKGRVYLVSPQDFSIPELETHFSTKLSRCRKVVISNFDQTHTTLFTLFIDSKVL